MTHQPDQNFLDMVLNHDDSDASESETSSSNSGSNSNSDSNNDGTSNSEEIVQSNITTVDVEQEKTVVIDHQTNQISTKKPKDPQNSDKKSTSENESSESSESKTDSSSEENVNQKNTNKEEKKENENKKEKVVEIPLSDNSKTSESSNNENKNEKESGSGSGSESESEKEKEKEKEKNPKKKPQETLESITLIENNKSELKISVGSPETIGSGMKKHTVYQVTTGGNDNQEEKGNKKEKKKKKKSKGKGVKRRYKDFLWLKNNLILKYPGVVVPAMPGKKMTSKFSNEFIEMRRSKLEMFLNRISLHPILSQAQIFTDFLEKNVTNIYNTKVIKKVPKDTVPPLNEKYELFKEKEGDQDYIKETMKRWETLGPILKEIQTESLKFRQTKELYANALGTFGEKIDLLRAVETKIQFQDAYTFFAKKLADIEKMSNEELKTGQIPFEESIDDYISLCNSVKTTETTVNKANSTLKSGQNRESKTKIKYEKAKTTGNKKLKQIKKEYDTSVENAKTLQQQYSKIVAVFANELRILQQRKERDIQQFLLKFSKAQLTLSKQIQQAWGEIIETIKSIDEEL
ncbi:sorting nexin [Anaeramoeba flamelloides]|uniref:Sorting nexin n=1 Tax=Anaeramoeba flamelloides TaxID=1746091 RepID=A0ABQ8YIR4_9EUKA|nr:sorting nexin [Anaeramoeba flamelloides]